MKAKKYYFNFIIVFLSSFCCSPPQKNEKTGVDIIKIDNTAIATAEDISELIEYIRIVPLKETQGNFLGEVAKFYTAGGNFIAFDRLMTQRICMYDSTGKYIKTIIKTGESPSEALQLNDCWVNEKGEIEAYDSAQKKIYQFDMKGNLKQILKSELFYLFKAVRRIPHTDTYAAYAAFNEYNNPVEGHYFHIAFLDNKLNLTRTAHNFNKKLLGIEWLSFFEHFYPYKDSLRFVQAYDNTIYSIINGNITERFRISYKKNSLPDDVIEKVVYKHLAQFKDETSSPAKKASYLKGFVRFNGEWLEDDSYIYITSVDEKNQLFFSLYDKKLNSIIYNTRAFFAAGKYGMMLPPLTYFSVENRCFMAVLNGQQLSRLLTKNSPLNEKVIPDNEVLHIALVKLKHYSGT